MAVIAAWSVGLLCAVVGTGLARGWAVSLAVGGTLVLLTSLTMFVGS